MTSRLDEIKERERRRYSKDILDPVQVNSLVDIQRIVASFDPAKNPPRPAIVVRSNMLFDGGNVNVSAESRAKSKRDLIIEGLDNLKKRISIQNEMAKRAEPIYVNNKPMLPASMKSGELVGTWVDPLIRQWTGGYRDGLLICWNIGDGYIYRYNIYEHRLTRVKKNDKSTTTTASTI